MSTDENKQPEPRSAEEILRIKQDLAEQMPDRRGDTLLGSLHPDA